MSPITTPRKTRRPVFIALGAVMAGSVVATTYSIASILGHVPMSRPILFGWFAVLDALNLMLAVVFWKRRDLFGIGAKALMILWCGLVFWYWFPAPIYYFLNMNHDRLQLQWAAFAWLWEVPGVGGGMHVLTCHVLFRPIRAYMDAGIRVHNPAKLYRRVLWYPLVVAISMFLVSVVGYAIGAVQFRWFSFLPPIEQFKNVMNGVTIAIFLGVIYYLLFDTFLGPVRARIEHEFGLTDTVKTKMHRKIFGVTLAITVGSLALVSLFVLQACQLMIRESVAVRLREALDEVTPRLSRAQSPAEAEGLLGRLQIGPHGQVFRLPPGQTLPAEMVAPETQRAVAARSAGLVEDLKRDPKLVAFFEVPEAEEKIASVVYLTDFHGPLRVLARFFAGAGLFVLILTVGTITIMSLVSTRAIRWLSATVKRAVTGQQPDAVHVHTADEIEELSHAFAYFIDQSHRLQRDLQIRNAKLEELSQELARSNEDLEQFAYVASHDLQEPLRMVASYTQLLARRYRDRLDRDADAFITFAVSGVQRMQRLITDLLAFSRVGRREKPAGPADCTQAVTQALTNLEVALRESGAVVTYDGLPTVLADPTQLTQLFQNLFSNAIKYRQRDIPSRIHVSAQRDGAAWRLSVQDNGIGLDMQYAERIFVIFQRLHTEREYPGTGIGLAICKKIVERHGGRIWVESKPGQGATFSFTIPEVLR